MAWASSGGGGMFTAGTIQHQEPVVMRRQPHQCMVEAAAKTKREGARGFRFTVNSWGGGGGGGGEARMAVARLGAHPEVLCQTKRRTWTRPLTCVIRPRYWPPSLSSGRR